MPDEPYRENAVADVRDYYDRSAEWERLQRPDDGAVESALHERAFAALLPPAPARILDLGGGPGRWTLWLAERGYRVILADLSPRLLEIGRARIAAAPDAVRANIEAIVEADARDLGAFEGGAFDTVLSLGPFYHLTDAADRDWAAAEARRVLRPHGLLFAAVMPRYMRLAATVLERGASAFETGAARRLLQDGVYHDDRPGRFTGGYFFRPEDVTPFFERHGFAVRRLMASQGFLGWIQADAAALAERDPEAYERLLDVAYVTAADPSLLGMAGHLLFIGQQLP
jgi:SAM-dependent methyltransferase